MINQSRVRTVALPGLGPSWMTIRHLPSHLASYAAESYDRLFDLRPSDRGQVVLMGETKDSPRWHKSYMKTPEWNTDFAKHSYMFGNRETIGAVPLPSEFKPFFDFVNEDAEIPFNQVVVNWYNDGHDYTPFHADCELGMVPGAEIAVLSLGHSDRPFVIRDIHGEHFKLEETCLHGTILTMHGDFQKNFRHGLPKQPKCDRSRISITFRKFL